MTPKRRVVLVVDPDRRTCFLLAQLLGEEGYDVDTALDAEAAIRRLSCDPLPDVVVSALDPPNANGVSVGRFARSRDGSIPLIVVRSHPEHIRRVFGLVYPRPVVFAKPLDFVELVAELARVARS
ncbi:MAG: response regulator [Deltaproteobacteria bacterium]|nr:response regulator [Deltaproteobacteria bacterium]